MGGIDLRAAPSARALPALDQAAPGKAPKPGTRLREVYDFLMANKGRRVGVNRMGAELSRLEDHYGLEIERVGIADAVLIGRTVGVLYHDYRVGLVIRLRDRA